MDAAPADGAAGRVVSVTTTYLHLPDAGAFRPAWSAEPDLLVMPAREPLPAFYRFLFDAVGRAYHWTGRLAWTDARLRDHLARPAVTLLVLYYRGTPAGYIELDAEADEPDVEVAYFGLIPAFHGRGFGKHLLSHGVRHALAAGAGRVWLHTCTLDGPYALANYRARGFVPYRTETALEELRPARV
jgi:ribosomal protein S18 acetylase RimI-like enzyme